jgi:hypothetical protein
LAQFAPDIAAVRWLAAAAQVIKNKPVYFSDLLLTRGFSKKRIGGPGALKGNLQDPILPLLRIRGHPNEHKLVDNVANW